MTIHTTFGDGEVVDESTVRGRTQYKVAGYGFEVWLDETDPAFKFASNPRDRAGDAWADGRDRGVAEHGRHDLADHDSYYPEDEQSHWEQDPEYQKHMFGSVREGADFSFEPSDHTWDNSTTLPYSWKPKNPVEMYEHEQTISPDHELGYSPEERTDSSNSRSGESEEAEHEYPGPAAHLFAGREASWGPGHPDYDGVELAPEHRAAPGEPSWQDHVNSDMGRVEDALSRDTHNPHHPDHLGSWERPAGLSDKYAQIIDSADHFNSPAQRFKDDPHGAIVRHGGLDLSAGLDHEVGEEMNLVLADKQIRTAAWKDVRTKAVRIVREGGVHVEAVDSNAIYANVDGDHGSYECMILTGSAYPNGGFSGGKKAIANWKCSCDWGKWAFKRQMTFVGRLCSHGYATYLTQQSHSAKNDKNHPFRNRPKQKRSAILDEFKTWAKEQNGDHIDQDAADTYLSCCEEPVTREDAQKILDYVQTNHTERPERDYDVKGYHYDNDSEVLQHQPGKLTPHFYQVPEGEEAHFEDLGDDRKTTGPDQIQARKTASSETGPDQHHPAFAWHVQGQPDMPKQGIVHFSALKFVADEDLLNRLRTLSEEGPSEHPQHAQQHNQEVSHVVDELHDRGFAASPLVAMKKAAMWKVADDDGTDPMHPFGNHDFIGDTLNLTDHTPPSSPSIAGDNAAGGKFTTPGAGQGPQGAPPGDNAAGPRFTAPGGGQGPKEMSGSPSPVSPAAAVGPGGAPGGTGGGGSQPQGPHAPGSSVPSPSTFQDGPGGTYTVKPGDNLNDIAQSHGTTVDAIQQANPNTINGPSGTTNVKQNADLIHPDDNLKLPSSGAGSGGYQPGSAGHGNVMGPPSPSPSRPGGSSSGGTADYKSWYPNAFNSSGGAGAGGMASGGVGTHASKRFAELYFQAADDDGGDDPNKKKTVGPSAPNAPGTPGGQGGPYLSPTQGNGPVNQPRPTTNAQGQPLVGPGGPHQPTPMTGGDAALHNVNPAGAPQAGAVDVSGPKGTDSTTSGNPGEPGKKPEDASGLGGGALGGGMGGGLSQAMGVAMPLISEIGSGIGGALPGLASGLGGAIGSGLSGLTKLLSHDPQKFAKLYFQADGAYETEGGPDWMDYPFAGSGPDRQNWSGTSENYVEEHEKANHDDTWMTDNGGDVIKYTERPKQGPGKQSRRHVAEGDFAGSGDAGFGSTGGMAGGTLSTGGSGMGMGQGGFESAAEPSGAATMGGLGGIPTTANMSESARKFWADIHEADAFSPGETGYFNPHNRPYQEQDPENEQRGVPGGHGKKHPGVPGEEEDDGLPKENPLTTLEASMDGSDIVRHFQASGGGCLAGGGASDDGIAKAAQRMLRTAGRNYSPAEQRELEEESHPRGARNLGSLELSGTHYVDE